MAETKTEELKTFIRVAKLGSFASAARELGRSTSGVSKQVNSLEERLGVRLLNRTTRKVVPTEVGRVFLERGEAVLVELEELEADVRSLQTAPRGTLRVSAPQDFGRMFLCGMMGRFAGEFPELRVEFELTDRKVDVIEEGFDVAIRLGELSDSSLVVHRIGICERVLCASPDYLAGFGEPVSAQELERHNCIEYEYQTGGSWRFMEKGKRFSVTPSGRLRTNAGWSMREMALSGLGVALLPTFLVAEDLESGALRAVLRNSLDADVEIMAVIPHRKQVSAKVRVFIDFIVETVSGETWFRG